MNSKHKNEVLEVIDWLVEHFPQAFFKVANKIRPLSLGIMDDLLDFYERLECPPFSKKQLRQALSFYTASSAYLKSQKAGVMRVDLAGMAIEEVEQEQEDYAKEKLAARREKNPPINQG